MVLYVSCMPNIIYAAFFFENNSISLQHLFSRLRGKNDCIIVKDDIIGKWIYILAKLAGIASHREIRLYLKGLKGTDTQMF